MSIDFIEVGQGPAELLSPLDKANNDFGYTHPNLHRYVNQQSNYSDIDSIAIILKDKTSSAALISSASISNIYLVDIHSLDQLPSTENDLKRSGAEYYLMKYDSALSVWVCEIPYQLFRMPNDEIDIYFVQYNKSIGTVVNSWNAKNFIIAANNKDVSSNSATWRSVVYVISDPVEPDVTFKGEWDYVHSDKVYHLSLPAGLEVSEYGYPDIAKTYMIGVHNNHSYRTVDYHVHDEESTTCEIP